MSILKTARAASAALALVLTLLVGCTRSGPPQTIRTHLPSEPVSLDPALVEDDFAVKVICNTMEGLVGYDGEGKLKQKLASKYEVSADGRRYVFTLRDSARWSDGKPVTPADFILGIRRSLDPKMGSKMANMLFAIRGARAYNAGKGSAEALGLSEDSGRLVIELENPTSYFIHALTLSQAAPSRVDVLAANGGSWPAEAPATGPYRIEKYVHEVEIRLVPNAQYWDPNPRLLPVIFKIIPDESQAMSLFETGGLDIVGRVAPLDLDRLRKRGVVHEFYQMATYFIAFNTKKPPFDDRDFRRAVAGAVDREAIAELLGTASNPARSWIPTNLEGFVPYSNPSPLFADSMARVKAKLAKGQPFTVTAALSSSNQNLVVMEKIQNDVLTKLGLHVGLQSLDFKAYVSLLKTNTPQFYRYQRGAPFMDPVWHLMSFRGGDANNFTGWRNLEYDRLVDEIASTPSGPARLKKILRAEEILVDDEAVCVPVYHAWQTHLVSPRVKGYRANPINEVHYDEVSISGT